MRGIAIGNGTASRETDAFVRAVVEKNKLDVFVVVVSEAGASIYSASKRAREEFPKLDVTVRGAISIARRLQDPLAELVKTDPKSIGVGQYQHDVDQKKLKRSLASAVESCVNRVGVDLNSASVDLLKYVSGIGDKLAQNVVAYRDQHGLFCSRTQIQEIEGFGDRTFEQAAGFLRIKGAENPLDRTA
ncbi:MAG: RNA-binding transcriptional accessory protein, partial [Acidobacteria bacterium]